MEKQTAVEWLFLMLNNPNSDQVFAKKLFDKAKEMEEEQIIDTWHNGYNNQSPMIDEENCGQLYYKETYKQESSE